jgi:formate dehydrogenase alpha subunit
MIKLKIDGRDVTVEKGTSILDAASRVGVTIPTLCHDQRLIPFGACRMCIVEERGKKGKLIPACYTPVRADMDIVTDSPKIRSSRRKKLELLLLNHPMDCPTCDKQGNCDLQKLVYQYGLSDKRYPWQQTTFAIDDVSPFIKRDPNKCILCGKCVRICDELQGRGALSFLDRGLKTRIGTSYDQVLACEFCGQCIDVCPVGALTSTMFDYETRWWELKEHSTVCGYCGCGCTLIVGSKGDRIKRVESDPQQGCNEGNLCVRGRFGWGYVHSPQRLTAPLLRKSGILSEVSWKEALQFTGEKLRKIKDTYGGQTIAGIASDRLTNEESYLFQKLMRCALNTNHIDHSGGFGYTGLMALKESLGYGATTNSISAIRKAETVMLLRFDPYAMHPMIKIELNYALRDSNPHLIAVNSMNCKIAHPEGKSPLSRPPLTLLHRPGAEVALINGMIQVIIEEDLIDSDFVTSSTTGLEKLEQQVSRDTPDYVESLTGVPAGRIRESAQTVAQSKSAVFLLGSSWGFPEDEYDLALALSNLFLLTGMIRRKYSGIYYLADKCNSQGALDMGVSPRFLPGFSYVKDASERKRFETCWGTTFPSEEGMGAMAIFKAAEEQQIKALYLVGENPLATYPGYHQTVRALTALDFLIVQELFLTETAQHAQVVFPGCCSAEKEGTFTSLDRSIQRLTQVVSPPQGAVPDGTIFMDLAKQIGCSMSYPSSSAIMDEINQLVKPYGGIGHDRLASGHLAWPCPDRTHPGTPNLFKGHSPGNKARFIPVESGAPEAIDPAFPYTLVTGGLLFHSGSLSLMSPHLKAICPHNYLELFRSDARKLNIEDGEEILVKSRCGEVKVSCRVTDRSQPGVVFMPYHFSQGANLLAEKGTGQTRVVLEKIVRQK